MYQLKKGQPGFEVVDGPMKGRKFEPGKRSPEVPPREVGRFEKIKTAAKAQAQPAPGGREKEARK